MSWDEIIDYHSKLAGQEDQEFREDFEKAIAEKLFLTDRDLFIRMFGLRVYRECRLDYLKAKLNQQIGEIDNDIEKRSPAK